MRTLKELRLSADLTQKELADLFGVHERTIFNVEKDSSNVKESLIKKYMSAFDVGYDDIFLDTEYEIFVLVENRKKQAFANIRQMQQSKDSA